MSRVIIHETLMTTLIIPNTTIDRSIVFIIVIIKSAVVARVFPCQSSSLMDSSREEDKNFNAPCTPMQAQPRVTVLDPKSESIQLSELRTLANPRPLRRT